MVATLPLYILSAITLRPLHVIFFFLDFKLTWLFNPQTGLEHILITISKPGKSHRTNESSTVSCTKRTFEAHLIQKINKSAVKFICAMRLSWP